MHDKSGKKPCTEVRNIEFISKQTSKFFVFTFLSLQFKFSVHSCIICRLIAFPCHPFAYFLTSGYLFQTPDNSNFFSISLEGLSYRESTVFKNKELPRYASLILPILVYFKCHKHLNHKTYNIFHSRTSDRLK